MDNFFKKEIKLNDLERKKLDKKTEFEKNILISEIKKTDKSTFISIVSKVEQKRGFFYKLKKTLYDFFNKF